MIRSGLRLPLHAWHPAWGAHPDRPAPARIVVRAAERAQPVETRGIGRATVSGAGR